MTYRLAYLMPPTLMGRQNGVVSQALTWRSGLETLGATVDLVSPWETYDWSSYDVIHAFGIAHYLGMVAQMKSRGAKRIVVSPIYDSNRPNIFANLLSRIDFPVGELRTIWAAFRASVPHIDSVLVRSDFEARKIASVFGVPNSNIATVPLSMRFTREDLEPVTAKQPICSHVSILSAPTKNVDRLVQAAVKYQFPLHLAGMVKNTQFYRYLNEVTQRHPNIKYHGVVSDAELKALYRRSRVFALPSLMEGVGLVGLEAAAHGADIVITDRGGPKEYYGGLARTVNPVSIDDIGKAVTDLLDGQTFQPALSNRILAEYSIEASVGKLMRVYQANV